MYISILLSPITILNMKIFGSDPQGGAKNDGRCIKEEANVVR